LTVLMLKLAISDAPGGKAGLGVGADGSVDHELATFQLVPVPSHDTMAADARRGSNPMFTATATMSNANVRQLDKRCIVGPSADHAEVSCWKPSIGAF
jgi:hypothetical protein